MKKSEKIQIASLFIVLAISLVFLFYNQATGKYFSDLELHLKMALDDEVLDYSITGFIYRVLYNYCGGNLGIAIFLTVVVLCNIIITKKVLDYYMTDNAPFMKWIYAFLLNFVIAIYIPFIHKFWNVGVQEANEWHNSTYLCMKTIGMIVLLVYLKIEKDYLHKIKLFDYIVFCVLLLIVNTIKPSFILVFAPAMLVFLIIDFIKNIKDKKSIINIIVFGTAVLISMTVLIYQGIVLYGKETDSTITIGFMNMIKMSHRYPIISIMQSIAFIAFIFGTNTKKVFAERKYSFVLMMNIIGLAQFLFLRELGPRATHGNFEWGYNFSLMMASISSVALLEESRAEKKYGKPYFVIAYSLLTLHILSGIVYFMVLLSGGSYY